MIAEIKGTHSAVCGSKAVLTGFGNGNKMVHSRSTLLNNRVKRSNQAPRVITAASGSSAAGSINPEAVKEEVEQFLRFRLATAEASQEALYTSTSWSVHNRLVDSFEKTHAHWE
jgi:hypothetical protein